MMMGSLPGRVFVFACQYPQPTLYWSDDRGATIAGSLDLSSAGLPGCNFKGTTDGDSYRAERGPGWGIEGVRAC